MTIKSILVTGMFLLCGSSGTAWAEISGAIGEQLGNAAVDTQVVGQVKRVEHATPLVCPAYDHVDLSMGVIRNGVGSFSKEDLWLYVPDPHDADLLRWAATSGRLVKITYDTARVHLCVEPETVKKVELLP